MKVIREKEKCDYDKNSVITVGTFDGIHLGHQKIIEKLNDIKRLKGLRSVVVTFEPHPQIVLKNRTNDIKVLATINEKLELFDILGIDFVYIVDFTQEFANKSAEEFYKTYLVDKIGMSDLVLGYDHKFGKGRQGNIDTLRKLSEKYNFRFHRVDEFKIKEEYVNSTVIRNFIKKSDVKKTSLLLGRKYSIEGKVTAGDRLGKQLGYPTANLEPLSSDKLLPKTGVYLVSVEIEDTLYYGMMNIGYRPTISENNKVVLEVNIFDFNKDIYNNVIKINFLERIRDEKKFNTLDELKKQLLADKEYSLNKINE